jgi:hypothetical protein
MPRRNCPSRAHDDLTEVTCDRVEIAGRRDNGEEIAELSGS